MHPESSNSTSAQAKASFFARLRGDTAGNALAIMAAFSIPLIFLAGSSLDIGRMYLVKTRLQQACDAGALAGRRFMTATSGTTLDATALTQANAFFASNFRAGWMGTTGVSFSPSRTNDGQVTATATATVPMTLTRMFNTSTAVNTVQCAARFDVPDTDVMFVLDTTGSMACLPTESGSCGQPVDSYTRPDGTTGYKVREKTGSRIEGLRNAVLTFYDTLESRSSSATHVRYGFVTYTSTVNVGYALPSSAIVDTWTYPSRQVIGDTNNGSATNATFNASTSPSITSSSACNALAVRVPATGYNTDGTAVVRTASWSNPTCTVTSQPVRPNWRYINRSLDVSQYKTGSTAVPDPSKITGAMSSRWQGCIEERDTTAGATSFSLSSLPPDLDPDLPATTTATRWRPMWPDVVYYRGNNATSADNSGLSTSPRGDTTNTGATDSFTNMLSAANHGAGYLSCGKPVSRLQTMTRAQVNSYITASDFAPLGGTYHDIGMIWGTRLISPTGLFASDTAPWPGNNPPARYIVFMTDGAMAPNDEIYGLYGLEYYDKRIKGSSSTSLTTLHNTRFTTACAAAKARGIVVYVVSLAGAATAEMNTCASSGAAISASTNAALATAFSGIAADVAALRLSQ